MSVCYRSYKNGAEKWAIAEGCLKVFGKLLKSYVPSVADFAQSRNDFNNTSTMGK